MLRELMSYLKENKKAVVILLCLAVGILFISFGSSDSAGKDDELSLSEYKAMLEAELEEVCSSVSGVGKCRVVITFASGEEYTYKGTNLTNSKPPVVMGITVICDGADSDRVSSEIVRMMTSLFDIGTNRVAVLKLK